MVGDEVRERRARLATIGACLGEFGGDLIARIARPALGGVESDNVDRGRIPDGGSGILVYCADYRCGHWTRVNADHWPDDMRLSDIEDRFTCTACSKRGADVRPDWTSESPKQK